MKRIITAVTVFAAAVTTLTTFGGCAENVKNTGNKIVSNAKDYLTSEIIDGDVSKLKDNAVSYFNEELGLNNNSNKLLEGTWGTDQGADDWRWTFDGSQHCLLASESNKSASEGTYSVDETNHTVEISLNSWEQTIPFKFELRQTLSDEYLDLSSDTQSYKLIKVG